MSSSDMAARTGLQPRRISSRVEELVKMIDQFKFAIFHRRFIVPRLLLLKQNWPCSAVVVAAPRTGEAPNIETAVNAQDGDGKLMNWRWYSHLMLEIVVITLIIFRTTFIFVHQDFTRRGYFLKDFRLYLLPARVFNWKAADFDAEILFPRSRPIFVLSDWQNTFCRSP
jgi:hypothetical protein